MLYTKVLEAAFLFCQTLPVRVLLHQEAFSSRLALQLYPASETALAIMLKKKIPVIILGAIQCILWVIVGLIEESLIKSINLTSNIQITYGIAFYLGLVGAVLIILGGIAAVATEAFIEPDEDSTIDNDF